MGEEEFQRDAGSRSPYERWVRRLYQTNMFNPVKLGLANIEALHREIGSPMESIPVVHIAGTNGKGSVALKIARTLQSMNPDLRVGLFSSPHVSCFRERMQVNDKLISEEQVVQYLPRLYEICLEKDIPATYFEITTALAFQFFADQADVVVLETGLGGRLDATNIIKKPLVSIITSIGLEHTRILGDTIEAIAREKGGIIKEGCPVLVGPHVPHDVLREQAQEKGASGYYQCHDILGPLTEPIEDYDLENARTAEAALRLLQKSYAPIMGLDRLTEAAIVRGTASRPPCRFEIVEQRQDGLTVVLDIAHNPPAMEYLLRKLKATYPDMPYRIVVGMSSDKDLGLCGRLLLNSVDNASSIHLVEAYHPRAAKLEKILEAEPRLEACQFDLEDRTIAKQIRAAIHLAREEEEVLVVCGSVFLMAAAREALGFDEPRDSDYIAAVAGANLKHGQENFANSTQAKEDFKASSI